MRHSKTFFAALAACLTFTCTANADVVDIGNVNVTSNAVIDESKYLSPGAATVVRADTMRGEQRSVSEMIENVPGLRVIRARGRNGYTVASIRGSTSTQVAVYVDGILINLQSEAAVDLSSIPAETIDRIEVYRGYIPARFGAQAMGGVINIVTKSPERASGSATFGVGSHGRYRASISGSGRVGSGSMFAAVGFESYDGEFSYTNDAGTPHDLDDDFIARRRHNGSRNADVLLKWSDDTTRAKFSYVRNRRDLAAPSWGSDQPDVKRRGADLNTDRYDVLFGRRFSIGQADADIELRYTDQDKHYDSGRPGELSPIGGSNVSTSRYHVKRFGAAFASSIAVGEQHFLEMLADYSDERLDVTGDTTYQYLGGISDYSSKLWSISLQDTIALDRAGTLLFTPSLRHLADDDDAHTTWQIALSKQIAPELMLKATYGTYARSPNLYERYGDGAFILPSSSSLRWETGTQYDIGLTWSRQHERLMSSASLGYFCRRSKDLLEFNMISQRFGRYTNIAEAEVEGIELESELDWRRWSLSISGTWMRGKNLTPNDSGSVREYGRDLPNRPSWAASARLTHKLDRCSIFAEYQYVGKNSADSGELVIFDAMNVWNIGARFSLSPSSELTVGVNDLFDDADTLRMRPNGMNGPSRILWYPLEGRSYYMTYTLRF